MVCVPGREIKSNLVPFATSMQLLGSLDSCRITHSSTHMLVVGQPPLGGSSYDQYALLLRFRGVFPVASFSGGVPTINVT